MTPEGASQSTPAGQLEPEQKTAGHLAWQKMEARDAGAAENLAGKQSSHREEVLRIWVQIHFKTLG